MQGETEVQVTVSLVNTGEAAWVSTALRTNSGQTSIRERVPRFGKTTAGPLRVKVSRAAVRTHRPRGSHRTWEFWRSFATKSEAPVEDARHI